MDSSEDFCYEVPIVNLEDHGIKNPKILVKESSEADNDCCIVEPENGTSLNLISGVKEVYHKKNEQVKELTETCLEQSATIVIDVDSEKDTDSSVMDTATVASNKNNLPRSKSISHQNTVYFYDELYRENPLLIELIEKCLDMENSSGMLRVINRTLIPIYRDVNKAFKESNSCKKLLSQNIMKLDTDPDRKFSHIKGLCEILKTCKEKKRVSLVTLKKSLNGKFSNSVPGETKNDVIDLDDDDDVLIDCNSDTDINVNDARGQITDETSSSVHVVNDHETHIEINDTENDSDIQINEQSEGIDDDVILIGESDNNSNKENKTISRNIIRKKRVVINNTQTAKKRRQSLNSLNNNESTEIDLCNEDDETAVTNNLIVPQNDLTQYIDYLEKQIASYNKMVKELEEVEVASDDLCSPYVQCELYKSKVVSLYKELCKLTGTESVKRHKVRLKVVPGRPEGPVRCLEEFINKNIDENGNPPFPDLHDVINCVQIANTQNQMGWSKKQIEDEARALFIHYGQTVQKRRQKREWRHLLTYVKEEAPDPADVDSALQARLLENAKVAKKNEKELLDRYAHMDNPLAEPDPEFSLSVEPTSESEEDGDYGSTSTIHSADAVNKTSNGRIRLNSYIESCKGSITENVVIYNPCGVLKQQTTSGDATYLNNTVNQNVQSTTDVIASMGHNYEVLINNPEYSRSNMTDIEHDLEIQNENQNREVFLPGDNIYITDVKPNIDNSIELSKSTAVQVNEVTTNLEEKIIANDFEETANVADNNKVPGSKESDNSNELQCADTSTTQTDLNEVVVKREPLDIPRMLEELGDNYTATIIDIEDPFLVIEISDSSDSEDEDIRGKC